MDGTSPSNLKLNKQFLNARNRRKGNSEEETVEKIGFNGGRDTRD